MFRAPESPDDSPQLPRDGGAPLHSPTKEVVEEGEPSSTEPEVPINTGQELATQMQLGQAPDPQAIYPPECCVFIAK